MYFTTYINFNKTAFAPHLNNPAIDINTQKNKIKIKMWRFVNERF